MKYIGFKVYEEDRVEWLEELISDRGHYKAYLINAKSPEEARIKLFHELYSEESYDEMVCWYLKDMSESYSEEENINDYGEEDGNLINTILDKLFNMTEDEKKEYFYDERVEKLSLNSKIRMSYYSVACDLGIIGVEKELK